MSDVYDRGAQFPYVFGGLAAVMGAVMVLNARVVERVGIRRLTHAAVLSYVVISGVLVLMAGLTDQVPFWLFTALLMVVLGGAGTLIGPVLGCAAVLAMREYLSTIVWWWQYVLGVVYILTILYLPTGLMGLPARIRAWRSGGEAGAAPAAKQAAAH